MYAGLGISSFLALGISLRMLMDDVLIMFALVLFFASAVTSFLSLILNLLGLRRISEGKAGEYDLVLTWASLFAAAFSSIFYGMLMLALIPIFAS